MTTAPAMTTPFANSLTRSQAGLLQAAAADGGRLTLPATTKPAIRERHLAHFLREGLVTVPGEGDGPHRLTAAGYRAVGLASPTPPSTAEVEPRAPATDVGNMAVGATAATPSKKAQVLALLGREQGATLAELTAATGWLPHTTRAALSRIRTGGQALLKAPRPDNATAYRIPAPVALAAAPPRARKPRRSRTGETAVTAPAVA